MRNAPGDDGLNELWGKLREEAAINSWLEVNELQWLFRGHSSRDPGAALSMVSAAWSEIGLR